MKPGDFAGAVEHGDAWRAFLKAECEDKRPPYSKEQRWHWFLLGWKAKGKQRVELRSRDLIRDSNKRILDAEIYKRDRAAGKYNNPLIKPEKK